MSFWKKVVGYALASYDHNVKVDHSSDWVSIEFLTDSGSWFGVDVCPNREFTIASALQNAKRMYPDNRVRAVTREGRVLDMMM
jgi:hypothetical protein